jgi:hypothetical protein
MVLLIIGINDVIVVKNGQMKITYVPYDSMLLDAIIFYSSNLIHQK